MKMTISDLWKKYEAAQAGSAQRAEEIREQEKAIAALKAEREQAASAGDFAAYDAKCEEIRKAEGRLYVLVKSARAGIVTPEDAGEYWREYADSFRKDQEKRLAEYRKTQKKAAEQYEEMIEAQNAALHAREDLCIMTGVYDGSEKGQKEIARRYALPGMLPGNDINKRIFDTAPEIDYFSEKGAGVWKSNVSSETLNNVVRLGRPVGRPDFGHK